MNTLSKQIKWGAIISYATLIINAISAFIYIPWMVSVIGKEDYALYTLATTFISIFMVDFGLNAAVSRFVAKYSAEREYDKIKRFVSTVEWMYFFLGIIIFIILACVYFYLGDIYIGLSTEELKTYKQLYIVVAMYSLISFPSMPFGGVLNAYEKFIQLKLCDFSQKMLAIFLTIIALIRGGDVRDVVLATVYSGLLAVIVKFVLIVKTTPIRITLRYFDKSLINEVFSFSIWVTIITLAQRCIFNLAPSILGIVSDSEAIAIFAPANTLESYFFLFASAVNGLFLPTVSRFIADGKEEKIISLMIKVGRYQLLVMGLILIVFLCVGKEFMLVWMGEEFLLAYPCAVMLFIPDILLFTQQIANTTAIAKNKVKEQSFGYVGMAIICLVLSFVLSSYYGVIGSAIAISLSYMFLFVYLTFMYKIVLKLDMKQFVKKCYVSLGIPMIGIAILAYGLCSLITIQNYYVAILVKGLIVVLIYMIFVYLFLDEFEKEGIKSVLKRKGEN